MYEEAPELAKESRAQPGSGNSSLSMCRTILGRSGKSRSRKVLRRQTPWSISLSWVARQGRPDIQYGLRGCRFLSPERRPRRWRKRIDLRRWLKVRWTKCGLYSQPGGLNGITLDFWRSQTPAFATSKATRPSGSISWRMQGEWRQERPCTGCTHWLSIRQLSKGCVEQPFKQQRPIHFKQDLKQEIGSEHCCEMRGGITEASRWEQQSRALIPHLCASDRRSLVGYVNSNVSAKTQDKRLGIELASIRQPVWDEQNQRTWNGQREDNVEWTATTTMPADCLPKLMKPPCLLKLLRVCWIALQQTK